MTLFLIRRLGRLVATLFVSSVVVFSSVYVMPGDPATILAGQRKLPPAALAELRARYHLDEPFLHRYLSWLGDALHGDLGASIVFKQQVSSLLTQKLAITLELVGFATVILVFFGVGLGLISGLRRGPIDSVIVGATAVLVAVPGYLAAVVLIFVFSVTLDWFPTFGAGGGGWSRMYHLVLPALALAMSSVAVVARVTRVAIREENGREHVQTAVARGLAPVPLVRRHLLRNAMMPITTVVGVTAASLFALSAVVEQAFSLNGIGSALIQAALARDMPVVQAVTLVYVTAFVLVNTLVDLCYASLDPRIKSRAEAS